jgi:hypothetical protein
LISISAQAKLARAVKDTAVFSQRSDPLEALEFAHGLLNP